MLTFLIHSMQPGDEILINILSAKRDIQMRNILTAISNWLASDRQQTNHREAEISRADAKPLDFSKHLG